MDRKILHSLKTALQGKKLIRLAHTIDEGLDQTVLDIPQEIWYKYPTVGEDFIILELEKRGIKCVRPFSNSHRDRDYFFDHLIWKMIADKYIDQMEEEPIFFTYKNSTNLSEVCFDYGFKELMPDYKLFKEIQYKSSLENYGVTEGAGLIPFINEVLGEISYNEIEKQLGSKFVVQFSFSATGWNTTGSNDTYIIETEDQYNELTNKLNRKSLAKISKFIEGPAFCMNVVCTSNGAITSDLYLQVAGEPDLSNNNVTLSGANFAESKKYISKSIQSKAERIAESISEVLNKKSFKGHFGIDFIFDKEKGDIYVLEINPRLTGSTFVQTLLADKQNKIPLIALHLCSYLECIPESFDILEYKKEMEGIWRGGSFYVLNRESEIVQINEAPKLGLYAIEGDKIKFIREEYNFNNIPDKDHFLVYKVHTSKRNINIADPSDPLCKIFSLEKIFDGESKLLPKYSMVNREIYKQFNFISENAYDSSIPYQVE